MQKAVFPIQSHADIDKAVNFIDSNYAQAIESGKPLRVVIDRKQDDRSAAQNRLYWKWIGEIRRKTGQDEDSLHYEFKKKFLIYIYRRDDQQFAEMCHAIAKVKQSEPDEYKAIGEQVIRLCSTTKATVKQMTEYLGYVHDFAVTQLHVHLTVPDDLKWCWSEL